MSADSFDVFLSHNSGDKPAVRQLAAKLKEKGVTVWLDEEQLVPGRQWQTALEEIVRTAKSVAVLVGKDGFGPWHNMEMRACLSEFVDRDLPVIPVLLPGAPAKPELPIFLKGFTWVDLREGFTDEGIERLKWGIIGTGAAPPPPPPTRKKLLRWAAPPVVLIVAVVFVLARSDRPKETNILFEDFVKNYEDVPSKKNESSFTSSNEGLAFSNWEGVVEITNPTDKWYHVWKEPPRKDPEKQFQRIRASLIDEDKFDPNIREGTKISMDGRISSIVTSNGRINLELSRISIVKAKKD